MISLASVFPRVLGIIALHAMADYLFRSHLLDAVGDATESASVFFSRVEHIYVTNLVLLLLNVTILVRG